MIKVSVLYPAHEGSRFDMDYYVHRHVAMIRARLGEALRRVEIDEGLAGARPGSSAPFVAAVHMYFDSQQAFGKAFGPHAAEILQDVANYTDIQPMTQIAKLVEPSEAGA